MKNKIINLFDKPPKLTPNTGAKYSSMLEQLLEPFVEDFEELEFYEDIIEFGINAWNSANIKLLMPKEKQDEIFNVVEGIHSDIALLNKMIDYKLANFKQFTNFIVDYDLKETSGDPILTITTQEQDIYLQSMFNQADFFDNEDDFEENFIDRSAIIVKPLQPFIEWCTKLYPEDRDQMKFTNTYLISENIEDIDLWLKNKFDKIFICELEASMVDKKTWPKKRNYQMFKDWFEIDISTMIFDFEKKPIIKF